MATTMCKHYRSMMVHAACEAGVRYESLKGIPLERWPCYMRGGNKYPGCDKQDMPTAEEVEAEEREWAARLAKVNSAREAIVRHIGGPWKRGTPGTKGVVDCPACGGTLSLHFTRAGYNGHIHARCLTPECVSWIE